MKEKLKKLFPVVVLLIIMGMPFSAYAMKGSEPDSTIESKEEKQKFADEKSRKIAPAEKKSDVSLPKIKIDEEIKSSDSEERKSSNATEFGKLDNYSSTRVALYINDAKTLKQFSMMNYKMHMVTKTLQTNPCPVEKNSRENITELLSKIVTLRITEKGGFNPELQDENLKKFDFDKMLGLKTKSKIKFISFERGTFTGKELVKFLQIPEIDVCKKYVKFRKGETVDNGTDFILTIKGPDKKEIRFDISFGYLDREEISTHGYLGIADLYESIISFLPAKFFSKKEDVDYIPETKMVRLFRRGYSPDLDDKDLLNFCFNEIFGKEVFSLYFTKGSFRIRDLIRFLKSAEIKNCKIYKSQLTAICDDNHDEWDIARLTIVGDKGREIIFDVNLIRDFLFGGIYDVYIENDNIEELCGEIRTLVSGFEYLPEEDFKYFPGTRTLKMLKNSKSLIDLAKSFFSDLANDERFRNADNIYVDSALLEVADLYKFILEIDKHVTWKKEIRISDCDKYYIRLNKDDDNQSIVGEPYVEIVITSLNGKKMIFFVHNDFKSFFDDFSIFGEDQEEFEDMEDFINRCGFNYELEKHYGESFFEKCLIKNGTFVTPRGLVKLDYLYDMNMFNINSIIISGDVIFIKTNQFQDCNFERIYIVEGVKYIKKGAFAGCKNLKEVSIPTTAIVDLGAFEGCEATNVKILYRYRVYNIEDFKELCKKFSVELKCDTDRGNLIFLKIKCYPFGVETEEYKGCSFAEIIEFLGDRVYISSGTLFGRVLLRSALSTFWYKGTIYTDINTMDEIFKIMGIRFFYKSGEGLIFVFPRSYDKGDFVWINIDMYEDNIIEKIKTIVRNFYKIGVFFHEPFLNINDIDICFVESKNKTILCNDVI